MAGPKLNLIQGFKFGVAVFSCTSVQYVRLNGSPSSLSLLLVLPLLCGIFHLSILETPSQFQSFAKRWVKAWYFPYWAHLGQVLWIPFLANSEIWPTLYHLTLPSRTFQYLFFKLAWIGHESCSLYLQQWSVCEDASFELFTHFNMVFLTSELMSCY